MVIWRKAKQGRILSQLLFLSLTLWVAIQMIYGVRGATIERYCPFGGVETLIPWISKKGILCSLTTLNISILAGVLVITVLFKRVFCSHICPLGSLLEWIGIASRSFVIGDRRIPERLDRVLKYIKYPLMFVIVFFTVKAGELVFRDFDPFYVLFTAGKGHGIQIFGLWVTPCVFAAGIFIPLSFCKYLCPMAACLAPFSRLGLIRVSRNDELCMKCGSCNSACKWGIKVSEMKTVTSVDCSNCQDCVTACSTNEALALQSGRFSS